MLTYLATTADNLETKKPIVRIIPVADVENLKLYITEGKKAYDSVTKHLYFTEVVTEGFPGAGVILGTASEEVLKYFVSSPTRTL